MVSNIFFQRSPAFERHGLMARYFFDLVDEFSPVIDEEGVIFDDDSRAREHAVWCAREVIANDVLADRPIRLDSYISVQEEDRVERFRVLFRDAISIIDHRSLK